MLKISFYAPNCSMNHTIHYGRTRYWFGPLSVVSSELGQFALGASNPGAILLSDFQAFFTGAFVLSQGPLLASVKESRPSRVLDHQRSQPIPEGSSHFSQVVLIESSSPVQHLLSRTGHLQGLGLPHLQEQPGAHVAIVGSIATWKRVRGTYPIRETTNRPMQHNGDWPKRSHLIMLPSFATKDPPSVTHSFVDLQIWA